MQLVRVIQTCKTTGDRLTEKQSLSLCSKNNGNVTLSVNTAKTFQDIIGFGGAFTESAAYTLARMAPEKRQEIVKKYFDDVEGLGYTLGRVHIHSCDFALGNYTYVQENDTELKTFEDRKSVV